jgi:ketosteroid isomerase-like protein
MNREQIKAQAQAFIAALHALEDGDEAQADGVVALFAPDAVLTNAALQRQGDERDGQGDVLAFWHNYRRAFGRARSEFHHITTDDSAAGLFWTTRGTYRDGAPLQYDGVSLLEFDAQGKIARFQGYFDTRQLSREIGA